jgi:hypothetical protein
MSNAALPFFFFGTLMDADVLGVVLGRVVSENELKPARLDGFERLRVRGERYPILRECPGSRLDGVLLAGLTRVEIARITFYEGDEYRLSEVMLTDDSQRMARAFTFVANLPFDIEGTWDLASWQAEEKAEHLAAARIFMSYFGLLEGAADWDARWREARRRALEIRAPATRQ